MQLIDYIQEAELQNVIIISVHFENRNNVILSKYK